MKTDNIYYVGTLQDLGLPFSSLYVDGENRQLYIFVRLSKSEAEGQNYVAAEISPDEVRNYMQENLSLTEIFDNRNCLYLKIIGNHIIFEKESKFKQNEKIAKLNYFDPELCDDEVWMETFLDRLNSGKPLVIA